MVYQARKKENGIRTRKDTSAVHPAGGGCVTAELKGKPQIVLIMQGSG